MPIIKFISRRLGLGVLTLFAVSVLIFLVTQAFPSDPAQAILGRETTPESLDALRQELGLYRPAVVQFGDWFFGVLRGDFGKSFVTQMQISEYIAARVGNSLFLMFVGAIFSIPISIAVGAYSALKRDKKFDTVSSTSSLVLAAIPEFVMGTALIMFLSTTVFHLLPAITLIDAGEPPWADLGGIVLPVLTLVLAVTPYVSRTMRASMIEILESDYVEMARLKGMSERVVLLHHGLPNALGPVFQVIALNLAYLAGGTVIVERLFNFPGIGSALADSVRARDLPVIQFLTLMIAGVYVLMNLIADVATVLATPRLRTSLK
ncbi:MAG: ABC transporter permease [Actinobacteria bacterium]|nr:ABC transporter permease [Actinomycetota bacterium]